MHIFETFSRLVSKGWQIKGITAGFEGGAKEKEVDGIFIKRIGSERTFPALLPGAYRQSEEPDLVVEFLNKLPLMGPLYIRQKMVVFTHHLFGSNARHEFGTAIGLGLRAHEWLCLRAYRTTSFLVGGGSTKADLVKNGIDESLIQIVPYGTAGANSPPVPKSVTPLLLYLGRLKRYKQVDHVLKVVQLLKNQYPDMQAVIAGEGDDRRRLERLTAKIGITDRVCFLGQVTDHAKIELMSRAWMLLYPSVKEGFGLTVAEAGKLGTPTVAYRVPGLVDAVDDDITGVLIEPFCFHDYCQAVAALLEDKASQYRLGSNAAARFAQFTWDAAASAMEQALLEALQSQHQR